MKHLVFFCEHLYLGGAPQAQLDYLRNIDPKKYKVSLIVELDPEKNDHLLRQIPPHVKVIILYPKTSDQNTKQFPHKYVGGVYTLLRKNKKLDIILRIKEALAELKDPDVLIGFTLTYNKYLAPFKKYKRVYWVHGPKRSMKKAELTKFAFRVRYFDRIVTVSDFLYQDMKDLLPQIGPKLTTLYSPLSTQIIAEMANDYSELSDFEQSIIKKPFLISVARLVPEKDFDCLLKAFSILKNQGIKENLIIIGEGTLRTNIEKQLQLLDLRDQVYLIGKKRNPFVWMKNSLFFLHAARTEGFGLAIVEAMLLGKAVVVSDCPVGPKEILDGGKYGILFPQGDATELAAKAKSFIENTNLRIEFEQKSLIRGKDFRAEVVMPKFYEMIESLYKQ